MVCINWQSIEISSYRRHQLLAETVSVVCFRWLAEFLCMLHREGQVLPRDCIIFQRIPVKYGYLVRNLSSERFL